MDVVELKKPLHAYRFELEPPLDPRQKEEQLGLQLLESETEDPETQLSFELERPRPRLKVVRRHPSI